MLGFSHLLNLPESPNSVSWKKNSVGTADARLINLPRVHQLSLISPCCWRFSVDFESTTCICCNATFLQQTIYRTRGEIFFFCFRIPWFCLVLNSVTFCLWGRDSEWLAFSALCAVCCLICERTSWMMCGRLRLQGSWAAVALRHVLLGDSPRANSYQVNQRCFFTQAWENIRIYTLLVTFIPCNFTHTHTWKNIRIYTLLVT